MTIFNQDNRCIVDRMINAMKRCSSTNDLDQLDWAAEVMCVNDAISGEEYDQIHEFYRTHYYSDSSGKIETLD